MSLFVSIASAFLFGTGFTLLLNRGLFNRVLGLLLISHGANFIIMTMAGLKPFPFPPLRVGCVRETPYKEKKSE